MSNKSQFLRLLLLAVVMSLIPVLGSAKPTEKSLKEESKKCSFVSVQIQVPLQDFYAEKQRTTPKIQMFTHVKSKCTSCHQVTPRQIKKQRSRRSFCSTEMDCKRGRKTEVKRAKEALMHLSKHQRKRRQYLQKKRKHQKKKRLKNNQLE